MFFSTRELLIVTTTDIFDCGEDCTISGCSPASSCPITPFVTDDFRPSDRSTEAMFSTLAALAESFRNREIILRQGDDQANIPAAEAAGNLKELQRMIEVARMELGKISDAIDASKE